MAHAMSNTAFGVQNLSLRGSNLGMILSQIPDLVRVQIMQKAREGRSVCYVALESVITE